ncbi:hypothetical protein HYU40_00590 [Candidatus Woesearchaeota archaeon]|nr:hypothetical protein [Candidatus Woesearchaeota archaeon]
MVSKLGSLLRNKKGDSTPDEMIGWIHRSVFTVIVALTTYFIIRAFIVTSIQVAPIEANVLMSYPHIHKDGFSKFDSTIGRLYPGVMDTSRFTTGQLKLLKGEKPSIVGRFARNQTIIDYHLKKEEPVYAYTDFDRYKLWQPLAQSKAKGEGGKTPYAELRYVTLADGRGAIIETVMIASN